MFSLPEEDLRTSDKRNNLRTMGCLFSSNTDIREAGRMKPFAPFLLHCGGPRRTAAGYPTGQPTEGAWLPSHLAGQNPGDPQRMAATVPHSK